MSNMFNGAINFNQDISRWNTGNVTNMSGIFNSAINFNQNISNWNVTKVTDMSNMFNGAINFNQNISRWNTGNVTNMSNMFNSATNFNQDISEWETGKVTDMSGMFNLATNFNQNIGSWNFDSLELADNMFLDSDLSISVMFQMIVSMGINTTLFFKIIDFGTLPNSIPLVQFIVPILEALGTINSQIKRITFGLTEFDIFTGVQLQYRITRDNNSPSDKFINNLDLYNPVSTNSYITNNSSFSISNGNIDILSYFYNINENITKRDNEGLAINTKFKDNKFTSNEFNSIEIINITNIPLQNDGEQFEGFNGTLPNNPGNIPDLSDVTNASGMFQNSNGDIDGIINWDVSNIQDMSGMFNNSSFNLDISNWNTPKLINIENLLANASSFNNKSINNWDLSNITNSNNALSGTNLSLDNMANLIIDLSNNTTLQNNQNNLSLNTIARYALPIASDSITLSDSNLPSKINNTNMTIDFAGFITQELFDELLKVPDIRNTYFINNTPIIFIDRKINFNPPIDNIISDSLTSSNERSYVSIFRFLNKNNTIKGTIHIGENSNDKVIIKEQIPGTFGLANDFFTIYETTKLINNVDLTISRNISVRIEYQNISNNNSLSNSAGFYLELLSTNDTDDIPSLLQPGNEGSNKTSSIANNGSLLNGTTDTGSSDSKVKIDSNDNNDVVITGLNNVNPSNAEVYSLNKSTGQLELVLSEQLAPDHTINPQFNTTIFQDRYLIIAGESISNQLKVITFDLNTLTLNKTTILESSLNDVFQTDTKLLFTNDNTNLHVVFAGNDTVNYAFIEYPLNRFVDLTGTIQTENIQITIQDVSNNIIPKNENNSLQSSQSDLFFIDNNSLYYYDTGNNQINLLTNNGFTNFDNIFVNAIRRIQDSNNNFIDEYVMIFDNQFACIVIIDLINNTYEIKDSTILTISSIPITTPVSQTENLITFSNSTNISNDPNISSIVVIPTNSSSTNTFFNELSIYEIIFNGSEAIQLKIVPDSNIVDDPSTRVISTDIIGNINSQGRPEYLHVSLVSPDNTNTRSVNLVSITGEVSCFLGETNILTPTGYVKIKDLKNNDEIISGSGNIIKIKSTRKTTTSDLSTLCKIPSGMFGSIEDTYVSKYHAIFDHNIKKFIRPMNVKEQNLKYDNYESDTIVYYNLELFDKVNDTYVANGMIVEGDKQKGEYDFRRRNTNRKLIKSFYEF